MPSRPDDPRRGERSPQERDVSTKPIGASRSLTEIKRQVGIVMGSLDKIEDRQKIGLSAPNEGDPEKLVGFLKKQRAILEETKQSGEDGRAADWLMGENFGAVNQLIVAMTMQIDRFERQQQAKQQAAEGQRVAAIGDVRAKIQKEGAESREGQETLRDKVWREVVQSKVEALMNGGPYTSAQMEKLLADLINDINAQFQAERPGLVSANQHEPFGPSIPLIIQEKKWLGLRNDGPPVNARFQAMADKDLHNFSIIAVNQEAQAIWGVR